jgi:hypothetical protein
MAHGGPYAEFYSIQETSYLAGYQTTDNQNETG